MSFQVSVRGDAAEVLVTTTGSDLGNGREAAVIEIVSKALEDVAQALGGYVALHASGTVKSTADPRFGGDNVALQINTIMPPSPPVPDAGLPAALGSPQNFPPEASTSTAQTADHADNAPQEPVPQPLQPEPVAPAEVPTPEPQVLPEPEVPVVPSSEPTQSGPVPEPEPEVAPELAADPPAPGVETPLTDSPQVETTVPQDVPGAPPTDVIMESGTPVTPMTSSPEASEPVVEALPTEQQPPAA